MFPLGVPSMLQRAFYTHLYYEIEEIYYLTINTMPARFPYELLVLVL